jgi:tetratricopeptide (TPR) repeat protein
MYQQAEALLDALGMGHDYQMAALCNNMSAMYREMENFEEAERMARKSIIIISSIPGMRLNLATSLINLGEVETRLKKFDKAEESLKTAIAIFETEAGGQDIHYAAAMSALGALYYYRGDYDGSIASYQKALQLIDRDFGHTAYYDMVEKNLKQVESERL